MKRALCVLLVLTALVSRTAAEPLRQREDLADTVTVALNDRASYVYTYAYPQVDPTDPSGELINSFYQYRVSDAREFEIPMNADYYRTQDPAEDIRVEIGYEVTCNGEDYFSVLTDMKQGDLETFAGHTFSRGGLRAGSSVALPYLLGMLESGETDTWLQDRQTARANDLVREMVWDRLAAGKDIQTRADLEKEDLDYGFFPEEDFYLDETGNPVFYLQPGFAEDSGRLLTFPITIEDILDEM